MATTACDGRFSHFVDGEALARVRGEDGLHSRLPSSAYTDGGFLALEYRRWLARTWLFVGRGHEIPEAGDVMPVPGHPFILVRNKTGEVRAFQNACRHRGHALVDGPLALDNAISMEAAKIKGIESPVAGQADILVVPDLEAGNMLAKNLSFLAGADAAGIVLGARVPIILTSRADSLRTRMVSCAVAALFAEARRRGKAVEG